METTESNRFYTNKELHKMFTEQFDAMKKQQTELLITMKTTQKDLEKYNGLHEKLVNAQQDILKSQQDISDIRKGCVYDATNKDSPLNQLSQKLTEETTEIRVSIDRIDKKLDTGESLAKGRSSVGNGIIKWSGWIFTVILFGFTLYSALK